MEMDLKVDEYLTGEKHQLGRHVTMLVIMLITIIVVSTITVFSLRIQLHVSFLAPLSSPLAPRDGPLERFCVDFMSSVSHLWHFCS